jgi:hypothetical protein
MRNPRARVREFCLIVHFDHVFDRNSKRIYRSLQIPLVRLDRHCELS